MLSTSSRLIALAALVVAIATGAACGRDDPERSTEKPTPAADTRAGAEGRYPEPRWPSYFKPPQSVDDLMPAARTLARNTSGFLGVGMGVLKAGESVLLVPTADADPMVLEAIKRALAERKITVHVKFTYEYLGQTREQALRQVEETKRGRRIEDAGIYQASSWVTGQFPNPDVPKAWLKARRPDVYAEVFPGESAGAPAAAAPTGDADDGQAFTGPQERDRVGRGIQGFMKAHPEVLGAFWAKGGGTGLRRAMYPMQDKFLGTFTTDNVWTLQSQMTSYPGDVWQLAEEQVLEPLAYADRIEVTDPEGTNLWADLTSDMAERWSQGPTSAVISTCSRTRRRGASATRSSIIRGSSRNGCHVIRSRASKGCWPARRDMAGSSRGGRSRSRTGSLPT